MNNFWDAGIIPGVLLHIGGQAFICCFEVINLKQFHAACQLLPLRLRETVQDHALGAETEELRLRIGQRLSLCGSWGEKLTGESCITQSDLETVINIATKYSVYAAEESMSSGYLTSSGGFRIGICGSVVEEKGRVLRYQSVSSLCIRIPRERKGIAAACAAEWLRSGRPNLLILGTPGQGKTTFLRDMIRCISSSGVRVGLCDERGEVAAMCRGEPQLDIGPRTDVLDSCSKAAAVPMLLKTMAPQVIAVDEVALLEDVQALELSAGSGAALIATVHASSCGDLRQKIVLKGLLDKGLFSHVIRIAAEGAERRYRMEVLSCGD